MASIQATAHAATWQQHMCVCVMPRTVWLYECSSPPPPPLISHIHPLGSSFFFCSHSHSSRLLACSACVRHATCAVWGCQLTPASPHVFISAATPTRCVPSHSSPLPVQSGTPGDFSSSLRSLAARFPLPPLLVCGSTLLKHERLLVAVFVCIFMVHC